MSAACQNNTAAADDTAMLAEQLLTANMPPEYYQTRLKKLAMRGDKAAIPALEKYLQTEIRLNLYLQGIGALTATGDPRAAQIIIDQTAHKAPQVVTQLIYALEQFPAAEIYPFLSTVAMGHPDSGVREAAGNVLATMKQHQANLQGAIIYENTDNF